VWEVLRELKLIEGKFQETKNFQTIDELEAFLLKHGESIVDLMGGEIDRIEMKLRVSLPESSSFQTNLLPSPTEKVPRNPTL
jgi:hypothetical protein